MAEEVLVEGFRKIVTQSKNVDVLSGDGWIDTLAWRRYFKRAWRVNAADGMYAVWESDPIPSELNDTKAVILIWPMAFACLSPFVQPTGEFRLKQSSSGRIHRDGGKLLSFCESSTNKLWYREPYKFYFEVKRREKSVSAGLGYLWIPISEVTPGQPIRLSVEGCDCVSERFFALCEYGEDCLAEGVSFQEPNARPCFVDEGVEALHAGRTHDVSDGLTLYWGDLHVHSNMANYVEATPEENYEYGRYVAGLDFMAITDQDHFLTPQMFEEVKRQANTHNVPGEFAAFIGYEWSSRRYGHRNVLFCEDQGVLIRRHKEERPYDPPYALEQEDSFARLTEGLKTSGLECILIPHHPSMTSMGAFDWNFFDSSLEAAVEIYSTWGSSEAKGAPAQSLANDQRSGSYVQDTLARGYLLGILGSGETGDGHPGNTNWRWKYAHSAGFPLTPLGGGLAAVWASELSRKGIFDALRARRCYAATNVRILLDFKIDQHRMGESIPVGLGGLARGREVSIHVRVRGTDAIHRVLIFRNNAVTHVTPGFGEEMQLHVTDAFGPQECLMGGGYRFVYYYVRVEQTDGHLAWSSPIWFREK